MADAPLVVPRLVGAPERPSLPPALRLNAGGWRWRIARWLMGGSLEAVSLLPARPIYPTDRLIIHLGEEGATNTAEVYHPDMASTNELLPIDDVRDTYPGTFVCLKLKKGKEVIGTFRGWQGINAVIETRHFGGVEVHRDEIEQAYYAPAGYGT